MSSQLFVVLLMGIVPSSFAAGRFAPGDRVQVTADTEVRATPSSNAMYLLSPQNSNTALQNVVGMVNNRSGSILGMKDELDANGGLIQRWWQVDFDIIQTSNGFVTGPDGWCAESALQPAPADTIPPTMPGGLVTTPVAPNQTNLKWNPSTDTVLAGLIGYEIFRDGVMIATTFSTNYQDTVGLSPSTSYAYTVQARDLAGNRSNQQSAPVIATTPAQPSGTLNAIAPGTWYEVPNSSIQRIEFQWPQWVTPSAGLIALVFLGASATRYFTESSAAYDATRKRFIIWGGGHNDYAGNEIYTFDVTTLQWQRVNEPTMNTDPRSTTEFWGYYPDANGDLDTQQPRSRHSYDYIQYVPSTDRLCSFGGWAMYPTGNSYPYRVTTCFDFNAKRWERKADMPLATGGITSPVTISAYDSLTQHAWVHVQGNALLEWDPVADTWTPRSLNHQRAADMTATIDTKRHRFAAMGKGGLIWYDLSALTTAPCDPRHPTPATCLTQQQAHTQASGDTEILKARRPGFVYDSVDDVYVAWSGERYDTNGDGIADVDLHPGDVYVFHPDTWQIKRISPTQSGPIPCLSYSLNPPVVCRGTGLAGGASNATFGRWNYLPDQNLFIYVSNHRSENVFFYKLDATAVAAALGRGMRGDLDGDGKVTLADVRKMIQMLLGQVPLNLSTADLSGDGKLSLADLRALIQLL